LFKSRLVLPFWYQLTQVVMKKRPLKGCRINVTKMHNYTVRGYAYAKIKYVKILVYFKK